MLTFKVAADHFAMPLAERWGVRPLINAGGVRTKYGGSFILPEVVAEMATLEGVFVDMSVLAAAAGKALRELTGAEWGMVTGGSAAGLTLATAACLVGDDPLARFQLPGAARGQIVAVPRGHLSLYDSAILAAGAELREVERVHELEAIGDRLAMIFFVGLREPDGAIGFDALAASAARLGVPILVDAASELLALPERWTRRGADLVVYSGGKRLGGPAGTGLLLGREDLVKAAGLHGDPNHGLGRSMKVTKEEIVGLCRAVEIAAGSGPGLWTGRREQECREQLATIAGHLSAVAEARLSIVEGSRSLPIPRLKVELAGDWRGLDGFALARSLRAQEPAIILEELWIGPRSFVIDAFCLTAGEEAMVGQAIAALLARNVNVAEPAAERGPPDVAGAWRLEVAYAHRPCEGRLILEQAGPALSGHHVTRYSTGTVSGAVSGGQIELLAIHRVLGTDLALRFRGRHGPDGIAGHVEAGIAVGGTSFLADGASPEVPWSARRLEPPG